jgi:hypothetical protein
MLGKSILIITVMVASPLLLSAETAEMALCRPYAAQLAQFMVKYIWLRAYSDCIGDENPKPPQLPTDWQSALQKVMPPTEIGVVDEATPVTPVDIDKIGIVPATEDPTPAKPTKKTKKAKPVTPPDENKVASLPSEPDKPDKSDKTGTGKSGFAKGSADWIKWCKRWYPKSFDVKTGNVIKLRPRRTVPCPA